MIIRVAPTLTASAHRVHGCTPRLVQALWLFSYCRCVTVERNSRRFVIVTRRLWLWRRTRVIGFDQVARINYRAQAVPTFELWRYLSTEESGHSDSALFFISLELAERGGEVPLFTVWEQQPRESDWLDRLAGVREPQRRIGDETAGEVVALLRECLDR